MTKHVNVTVGKIEFSSSQVHLINENVKAIKDRNSSAAMSSLERWLTAENHKEPDYIPARVAALEACARTLGATIREILTDPSKAATAAIASAAKFGGDDAVPYADPHIIGPEEIGTKVEYPENSTAKFVPGSYPVRSIDDIASLKVPDPYNDGKIPMVLSVIRAVSEFIGDKVFIMQNLNGPFGHAGDLRGPTTLLADVTTNPELVHELMKFTTKVAITIGKAVQEAGACPIPYDAMAAPEYIGKRRYMELLFPYEKEMIQALTPPGCYLGIDGDVRDIIEAYADTGAKAIRVSTVEIEEPGLDVGAAISEMKKKVGHKTMLLMHVAGARELFHATPTELEEIVRRSIGVWAQGGAYAVGGGALPPDAPDENPRALVLAVKKYGKYPIR